MPHLSVWEILIIVLVIVVIFGAGRIAKAGGELGKGIKAFKDGLHGKDDEKAEETLGTDQLEDAQAAPEDAKKSD
jgi:sec-independent protein translocase protein TatA